MDFCPVSFLWEGGSSEIYTQVLSIYHGVWFNQSCKSPHVLTQDLAGSDAPLHRKPCHSSKKS